MLGRQLKAYQYQYLSDDLMRYAHSRPLNPIYEVDLVVNDERYTLFVQPERRNTIYALYALRADYERDVGVVGHTLITENAVLSALLELLVHQGVRPLAG
jgi:hypothetical protein